MFDIGWSELLLIGIVALIVVGPKELPGLFRTVGRFMGKARGMAREFQRSMEQAADDSGLNEAAGGLKALNRLNLNTATTTARKYAENSIKSPAKPAEQAAKPAEAAAQPAAPPAPAATPAEPPSKPAKPAAKPAKPAAKRAKPAPKPAAPESPADPTPAVSAPKP